MEPKEPRREKVEKREADWKRVLLLELNTGEEDAGVIDAHGYLEARQESFTEVLTLLADPNRSLCTDEFDESVQHSERARILGLYQRALHYFKNAFDVSKIDSTPLHTYVPAGKKRIKTIEYAHSSSKLEIADKVKEAGTMTKGIIRDIMMQQIRLMGDQSNVDDAIYRSRRPDIMMLSDSHSATAHMLSAGKANGFKTTEAGLLVVDRHTDMGTRDWNLLIKSQVMGNILNREVVGGIGVVGPSSADFLRTPQKEGYKGIPYDTLYDNNNQFSKANLQRKLEKLFDGWKQQGLKYIYPSIDLDGLRIESMMYRGTDYNNDEQVYASFSEIRAQDLETIKVKLQAGESLSFEEEHIILGAVDEAFGNRGLPASVVPLALEQAKAAGFEIGVPDYHGKRYLMGDVVELKSSTDYEGYTTKIAYSIMNAMIAIGQKSQ